MSADNGVYILKTRGNAGKPEYRVGYATAIDNLYYDDFDVYAYYWFSNSKVYVNQKEACKLADELYRRYEMCNISIENDIDYLDFSYCRFPASGDEAYSDPAEIWEIELRADSEE